jgi:hypothetical protein
MSKLNSAIANDYVLGKPLNTRLLSKLSDRARFSYDEYGVLWSYEVIQLARWLPNGILLVNADEGPSKTTREQQKELREAIKQHGLSKVAYIPYSALRAAGLIPDDVILVDVTPDREIETLIPCRNKKCAQAGTPHKHLQKKHFLGETLFRIKRETWDNTKNKYFTSYVYYVSGLDRNDDPERRNFFLVQLPSARPDPTTVDEALALLRPKDVPKDALRQGEWFLISMPEKKFKPDQIIKNWQDISKSNIKEYKKGVPILSDNAKIQFEYMQGVDGLIYRRHNRHRATRMVCDDGVYVSGMLYDADHSTLKLGNGKTWFKVVKNRAVNSWRAGGNVD